MAETLHALVLKDTFVESRMVDPANVPAHKIAEDGGKMLRPFIDTAPPEYVPALQSCTSELVVTPEQVERVWSVQYLPLDAQKQAVKAVARERILRVFPEWKQANMTARATELVNIKTDRAFTPEEAAEFTVMQTVWDWIKSVRAASNVLEAMNPVPLDFSDDQHWPEEWGA